MGAIMVYGQGRTDLFPSDKIKQVVIREGSLEIRMQDSTPYTIRCGVQDYNERRGEWIVNENKKDMEREIENAFTNGISRFKEID